MFLKFEATFFGRAEIFDNSVALHIQGLEPASLSSGFFFAAATPCLRHFVTGAGISGIPTAEEMIAFCPWPLLHGRSTSAPGNCPWG